jgi:hypothetical protein
MKLLYKPFALIASLIAARIGKSLFRGLWSKVDEAPPPKPDTGEGTVVKVVAGAALRAGVMAGVAAAIHRGSAKVFHHLIGAWPDKPAEENED